MSKIRKSDNHNANNLSHLELAKTLFNAQIFHMNQKDTQHCDYDNEKHRDYTQMRTTSAPTYNT